MRTTALVAMVVLLGAVGAAKPRPWYCNKLFALDTPGFLLDVTYDGDLALQDLRPRVGLSYTLPLLTNDSQVGNTYGHGNILDILDGGIRFLSYATVMLDGIGTIALQGITSTPDGATSIVAIVGGTGAFRGANGQAKIYFQAGDGGTAVVTTISLNSSPKC